MPASRRFRRRRPYGRRGRTGTLEEPAPVAWQRPPVGADHAPQELLELVRTVAGDLLDRHDDRRVADDAGLSVDDLGELRERPQAGLRLRLRDVAVMALELLARRALREERANVVNVQARIPELEVAQTCEPCHRLPVAPPTARLTAFRCLSLKPRSRPATAKLATRRFTSHSKGPGSVSSKSLMLKTSRRSGERTHRSSTGAHRHTAAHAARFAASPTGRMP